MVGISETKQAGSVGSITVFRAGMSEGLGIFVPCPWHVEGWAGSSSAGTARACLGTLACVLFYELLLSHIRSELWIRFLSLSKALLVLAGHVLSTVRYLWLEEHKDPPQPYKPYLSPWMKAVLAAGPWL